MYGVHDLRFFLDSGAFSAWTRNAVIDLDEYIAFIKRNIDHIDTYANLDVLPGVFGESTTPKQKEQAACKSFENFMKMRAEGLDPLPVFHIGERWEWLEVYEDIGCDYIGLGGLVGQSPEARRSWLDDVFDRLCHDDGSARIKTHGFGMTSLKLMFRYPWHSVDSTTWIRHAQFGAILVPSWRDGFVFDETAQLVTVSQESPQAAIEGKHANTLGPSARGVLERWLKVCGVTYAQVEQEYGARATCNVRFFRGVSEAKLAIKFRRPEHRRVGFF